MSLLFHSLVESRSIQMYFCLLCALFIMAGFDDDDISLPGLTEESNEVDVTVISDSDDNYEGLSFVKIHPLEVG